MELVATSTVVVLMVLLAVHDDDDDDACARVHVEMGVGKKGFGRSVVIQA